MAGPRAECRSGKLQQGNVSVRYYVDYDIVLTGLLLRDSIMSVVRRMTVNSMETIVVLPAIDCCHSLIILLVILSLTLTYHYYCLLSIS